jgi:hypothetical protein
VTDSSSDELLLLTRQQAAAKCQISTPLLDEWTHRPGFPVIRRGTHFVRIHARLLDEWLVAGPYKPC